MSQLFKVIITDNLNRDYKPEGLVTMAMSENVANQVANLLNNIYGATSTNFAKAVPADQPLNISSQYDLIEESMPYDYWCMLTGAAALPDHVAEYWYYTTILNHPIMERSKQCLSILI